MAEQKVIHEDDKWLMALDAPDLERLLEMEPAQRLAEIVHLNRSSRYANGLNAFLLLDQLAEVTRRMRKQPDRDHAA